MPPKWAVMCSLFLALCFPCAAPAQEHPLEPLQTLLRGNDQFGLQLMKRVHAEKPNDNLVIAPLSLTVLLSAIQTSSVLPATRGQLGAAFGWGPYPSLGIPSRMVLATMDEPIPSSADRRPEFLRESLWITNRIVYRSPNNGSSLLEPRFTESAKKSFGLEFVKTGDQLPTESYLRGTRTRTGELPKVDARDQVWFSSGTHLRQTWEELFEGNEPRDSEFQPEAGFARHVKVVDSQLKELLHIKTDQFEAVVLPCGRVSMTIVLPKPGMKIAELEDSLAAHPGLLNGMTKSLGSVTLTQFEIKSKLQLADSLKAMGITEIFERLDGIERMPKPRDLIDVTKGFSPGAQARVTDVGQTIDFAADRHGIRADSETLIGTFPIGLIVAPDVFHMTFSRPFLFFVRENTTGALVFEGALMDPAR
jgi:serine protease inhibitor